MTKDCEVLTVNSVSFVHGRGPVYYASLTCGPRDTETPKGHGTNGEEAKHRLVSALWDHLVAMESPLWKRCQSSNRAAFPIHVVHNPLGRPQLLLGECEGPAISFSEGGGKIWAALCGDVSDIGIDAAETDEFSKEYPFHRVFHVHELQHVLRLTSGDLKKASALLWSVKEAVVKALGCAFHLVDPREICVRPSGEGGDEYTFSVCLSGKALVRFPIAAGRTLLVRSLAQRKGWLSLALLNRRPAGDE